MRDLLSELKRRKVFKVGAAYLVVAWLLIQVVATLAPQLQLPEWAPRLITLILMIGFPISVVMAWVFDSTPDGVRLEAAPTGNRRVAAIAITLVALALGWYFLGRPTTEIRGSEPLSAPGAAADSTDTPAETGSDPPGSRPPRKSIAVLAFTDMSPTKDQEYFSDGIAEEILNALVRVKDIKVAGRTSSFYYKGRNEKLEAIGRALGVAHILEGSVRKQGDKVRITAQLIQTEDGFHLWSETYDGDLSDVFDLQERIARAITGKLEVILKGEQEQRLVPVATKNPEAYALYLQATAIFNRREGARIGDAIAQLEEALALDPKFARAHSRLAALHAIASSYTHRALSESHGDAERHARNAIELDGTLAEPYAVLGNVYGQQRRYLESRAAFERALSLDPDDVTANFWFATALITSGYRVKGNAVLDRVLAIDPILPNALNWRGQSYAHGGDFESAERLLRRAADLGIAYTGIGMALVEEARGRKEAAIEQLAAGAGVFMGDFPPGSSDIFARGALGDPQARAAALEIFDDYLAAKPAVIAGIVPNALIRLGEPARGLALGQLGPTNNDALFFFGAVWSSFGSAARVLPEFPEFARRTGLTQLWDEYGAPDLCRKTDAGEYVCE